MKKFKICSVALLLLIMVGCALLLLSCDTDPCADGHTEVVDAAVSATCEASGLTEGKHCSVCNKTLAAQEKTEKAAHNYGNWNINITPSCTQQGSQYRSCKSCKVVETQVLEAHTYDNWTIVKAATCEQSGLRTAYCTECDTTKEEVILPTGHVESNTWEKIAESSCKEEGKDARKCVTCSTVLQTRPRPVANHDFGTETRIVPEECLANITTFSKCKNCAEVRTTVTNELTQHAYGTPQIVAPGCTTIGTSTKVCSKCNDTVTQITPANGHTDGTWTTLVAATNTNHGSRALDCSVCHEIIKTEGIPSPNPMLTFSYLVQGNTVTITGYGPCALPNLVIPEKIENKDVTRIAKGAFVGANRFTSITFPSTLTVIEAGAFDNCTLVTENNGLYYLSNWIVGADASLTTLTIGSDVLGIAEGIFDSCNKPSTITVSGNSLFATTNGYLYNTATKTLLLAEKDFTGALTIPSTITAVADSAFAGCFGLHEITIPTSVKRVGANAFAECHTLVRVMNLSGLNITLPSNPGMEKKTSGSFSSTLTTTNGITLYKPNTSTTYMLGYTGTSSVLDLTGKGVTAIYQYALCGNTVVKELTIPSTIAALGKNALANCELTKAMLHMDFVPELCYTHLKSLIITGHDNRNEVPSNLLSGCTTLEELELPNTILVSRKGAFAGCTGVKILRAPANALTALDLANLEVLYVTGGTSIPTQAFYNHKKLKSVTIAASVTTINHQAFFLCSELETITFASNSQLKTLGNNAVCSTPKLKSINLQDTKLETIGGQCFSNAAMLTSITLPTTLTYIGYEAFRNCTALTSITIPANVTTLENRNGSNDMLVNKGGVFAGCTKLASVTFASGSKLTLISSFCFYGCTALTEITIPASVTTIGCYAFEGSGVTKVTFANTSSWKAYQITSNSQIAKTGFQNLGSATTMTVTTITTNATNFKTTYKAYAWIRG